ncbi:hypothetical protein WN943_024328 [Citrus x changshan-huyou]
MTAATDFIWRLFQQNTEADRKNIPQVDLFIDDMKPGEIAFTSNNGIHYGDDFIQNIPVDLIKQEFSGVMYHEMTHANYVPEGWAKPGEGTMWNQGHSSVAARFLDYCNDLRNGFVAELNKKMRDGYNDNFFMELLGKSIDQLWNDYKAKYGN